MTTTRVGVAAMAALLCACGSDGGGKPAPARAPDRAATGDAVYGQIPHDTPFLYLPRDQALGGAAVKEAFDEFRDEVAPALAAIDGSAMASMEPGERLMFAGMRVLAELDDDELKRLGLLRPDLRVAMYGYGLVPVMRVELDGARLRTLWTDATKRASVPARFEQWHGKPYLHWPLGDEAELVVMMRDDQLAAAVARRAADILPHLAGEAPPARPLDAAALTFAAGLKGELTLWFDPARTAALLHDGGLAALVASPEGCGAGLATVLGGLAPVIGTTYVSASHVTSTMRIGPAPALTDRLRTANRGIAHWPAAAPGEGVAYVASGVSLLPLVETGALFLDDLDRAGAACGASPSDVGPGESLRNAAAPLAVLHGFTLVSTFFQDDVDSDALPMSLALVADIAAPSVVYHSIKDTLGLPEALPALDQPVAFTLAEMPASLTVHATSLSATIGRTDAATLATLRTAPAGGDALSRMRGGADAGSDGGRPFDGAITLDGANVLVTLTQER